MQLFFLPDLVLVFLFFYQAVSLLIENGIDLDSRNSDGQTPLHVMAKKGRLSCIVALISNGADISTTCNDGKNALHYAVEVIL